MGATADIAYASTVDSLTSLFRQLADVGEVAALEVMVGDRLGRYQLVAELGRGGFGVVFEARDLVLPRSVAIKILRSKRSASEEAMRHFQREAEAVAALNHPRIVTIHDFGSNGDVNFLVLELLRGETLSARLARGPLDARTALEFAAAIAEGVACAHSAGVTHRDLKPSNVFVTINDGIKLVDFGLARSSGAAASELDHAGTPEYMAPEQLDGQAGDMRSDVYALGLILYELFGGRRLPTTNRAHAEVAALELDVPAALRQVCARALALSPRARYGDGIALFDALQRARREIERRRRIRWLAAVGGTLLVVLTVGLGVWLRARHRETTRVRLAGEVAVEVRDIEARLRYAHLQPLHDVEPDEAAVRATMHDLEQKLDGVGDFGEGAGELALGRGYLALHDAADAQRHLEAAERLGYRGPEVSEALGVALGERYRSEAIAADRIKDPDERVAARARLQALYRAPGLALLHRSRPSSAYTLALIALYEQRYDDALALSEQAFAKTSWMYEAIALGGEVHVERARTLEENGRYKEVLAELEAAGEAYARASAIGRSDPALLRAEITRAAKELRLPSSTLPNSATVFAAAHLGMEQALKAAPHDVATLDEAAAMLSQYAMNRAQADEWRLLDEALLLADRALALAPDNPDALAMVALIHGRRFAVLVHRGLDTAAEEQRATVAFEHALARSTSDSVAVAFAAMLLARADIDADHSIDPTATLTRVLRTLEHVTSGTAAMHRGRALTALARYQGAHGVDPHATYARAADAFDESNRLRPNHADTFDEESGVYFELGGYERMHGQDGAVSFVKSIECSERALVLRPDWASGRANLGVAQLEAAHNEQSHERDPRPLLARARASLRRSAELDPNVADTYTNLALCASTEAFWLIDHHLPAGPTIEAGLSAVRKSMTMTQIEMANLPVLADLEHCAAQEQGTGHQSPVAAYARALATNQKLRVLDPKNAVWHGGASAILRNLMKWKLAAGLDITAELALGKVEVAESLRLEPDNPEWQHDEARLRLLRAQSLKSPALADQRRAEARAALVLLERVARTAHLSNPEDLAAAEKLAR